MFTGLVREVGRVASLRRRSGLTLLEVRAPRTAGGLAVGDSLAVNGICLTVTRTARDRVHVEASAETRRVTTLARWRTGDRVHLEPALRAGDALGGHFVLGHVDGVGRVVGREGGQRTVRLTVGLDQGLCRLLLPKGSIAVDGVSLTLDGGPFRGSFTVTLVPHTLRETHFEAMRPGDEVNIELDVLSKAAAGLDPHGAEHRTPPPLTAAGVLSKGWAR
jgi:riboflavin synthase